MRAMSAGHRIPQEGAPGHPARQRPRSVSLHACSAGCVESEAAGPFVVLGQREGLRGRPIPGWERSSASSCGSTDEPTVLSKMTGAESWHDDFVESPGLSALRRVLIEAVVVVAAPASDQVALELGTQVQAYSCSCAAGDQPECRVSSCLRAGAAPALDRRVCHPVVPCLCAVSELFTSSSGDRPVPAWPLERGPAAGVGGSGCRAIRLAGRWAMDRADRRALSASCWIAESS